MNIAQNLDNCKHFQAFGGEYSYKYLEQYNNELLQSHSIIFQVQNQNDDPKQQRINKLKELIKLQKLKNEQNKQVEDMKEVIRQKILKCSNNFQNNSKKIYLQLLNKQKESLQKLIKKLNEKYEQQIKINSLGQYQKDQLNQLALNLIEQNQIDESLLFSKRSELRKLQAQKIIKAYDLYKLNYSYEDFRISEFLESHTISNIVVAEDDTSNQSSEKNIWKINYKAQHLNLYSQEHKQIINYSFENLIKFIEYVLRVKNFEIPFYFYLDQRYNLPNLLQPQYSEELVYIYNSNTQTQKESIKLFNENLMPNYENFVYCWINYQILYKRLGMDFKKLVLDQKLIFPVHQLKEFFQSELDNIKSQLPSVEYQNIVYNNQLINSDLLQIKYHKNSLKVISEEITIFRDDPNLQIIHDINQESKLSETEQENSDLERSFEFI
ncbi:hypothetical protein TTHERM_00624280 (macronuclear) [Tetrahymena thermophila SB210]|uniref:Uncharacterized protein n=1 Tax=Tetrahymena thermophila (strain SB210) TaxID=312017 RepID=Q240V5_TETTS|nr:hypothetical protein TTHERM_00624280 [Tetrahymena thermophila SB210]EAS02309.2 hypothetical protein TTHERM_00624280 [Tetrahymena thermophila SB210]|eukprot:XP_001022554.2 hypothetical protein TTHERM_00624280 [Tetrahymena thermophila SB210]